MLDQLYTFVVFVSAICLIPVVLFMYIAVRACHILWLYILRIVHSDVDFIEECTVRTLVDTRRNQGIFTVLIRVEGQPRTEQIKQHIEEVITRVNKQGEPRFPKLSMLLVSKWGSYAWKPMNWKEVSAESLVLQEGNSTHRGRPLTEHNVREHVSDIITRYLPRGLPPWQLVIIPCNGSGYHYLLLRMHHLLLTDGDVNIADILPLATSSYNQDHVESLHYLNSPLDNVLKRPDHVKYLYQSLSENLTNRWNEFTSNHDPINSPELLKNPQGIKGFYITLTIAFVAIVRRILIGYKNVSPDFGSRLKYCQTCVKYELISRDINLNSYFVAVLVSLHPLSIILSTVQFVYNAILLFTWKLPRQILLELQSAVLRYLGYNKIDFGPETLVDVICDSYPLVQKAAQQAFSWIDALYHAPRLFIDEMLMNRGWPGGTPVPLCGRKVVAWSKPIKGELLSQISEKTGLSCTEVLLSCLGGSLSDYYKASGTPIPETIPITARRISSGYLFSHGPNVRPQDAVSGLLCLQVPTVSEGNSYPRCLNTVSNSIAYARLHQACIYAVSVLQTKHRIVTRALPSVLVVMLMRYLSKKYTVAVTELMAGGEDCRTRYTTWGERIHEIIYWRPPQANISMSLCLNYYGDEVTLAVMSDALLSPHHVPLAEGLPDHVNALGRAVGVIHPLE